MRERTFIPLELYLVRHGIAADTSSNGSDRLRALTPEGIAALHGEAAGLARLKVRLDLILTSPLVRARETAEVLASHLGQSGNEPPVILSAAVAPEGSPAQVLTELRQHTSVNQIAVVGHEPGIGELAALCLGAHTSVPFKKGGVCRIDFEGEPRPGSGVLRWFAKPKMLILMGRAPR